MLPIEFPISNDADQENKYLKQLPILDGIQEKIAEKNSNNDLSEEFYKNIEKELAKHVPESKFWYKLTFIFLGIASLAGWNAILTGMDFFNKKYPKEQYLDISFYFPIPIMITNFIGGVCCPAIAHRVGYKQRIGYCLLGDCITMISITLIAVSFNTKSGYWISFTILFIQGFIGSIATSSLITLSAMISEDISRVYWTSTALSGLAMNFIRILALAIIGDSPQSTNTCTILYFALAGFIYFTSTTLLILFLKTPYFQAILKKLKIKQILENRINKQNSVLPILKNQKNIDNNDNLNNLTFQLKSKISNFQAIEVKNSLSKFSEKSNKEQWKLTKFNQLQLVQYFITLLQVLKYTGAIPFFIVLNYIQTFMMFPGVSIFQKTTYYFIVDPWIGVFMTTIFNFGDLVGKYCGGIKIFQKVRLAYGVVIFRFLYFILFLMTARHKGGEAFQNDIFAWFNMFIFAVTNGFSTTTLMHLGPKKAKDPKVIDLINFTGGFSISLGIMIGTFLALSFSQ